MTGDHKDFDELHSQLMALLDRIDVAVSDLAVDSDNYHHDKIENGIHELTRQRFDIMEKFGYKIAMGPLDPGAAIIQ